RLPSEESLASLAARLRTFERGILVCGPDAGGCAAAPAVVRLAMRLRWPILADPLSGLRFGRHDRSLVVDAYDVLLREPAFCSAYRPEAVVQLGRLPASKALERFLAAERHLLHLLLAPTHAWPDPLHRATDVVHADPASLCALLAERVGDGVRQETCGAPPLRRAWADSWVAASGTVRAALDEILDAEKGPFEGKVFTVLERLLPDGAALHVGNSTPVRDADTFLGGSEKDIGVFGNRGANGIDGVVATAFGSAAVRPAPTALVVGDLSFLHDLGALQIAARHRIPLLVVLVHNDGGGIFSFLPQAALGDAFETFFATPHGLDPEGAVTMCGGLYTRAGAWEDFAAAAAHALHNGGLEVVAVASDRGENVVRHREIVAAALARLRATGGSR
ncbi:MAG: thiamine pyrophosphate-dependent enzyme, partial [Candidatus Binatia bacterium]